MGRYRYVLRWICGDSNFRTCAFVFEVPGATWVIRGHYGGHVGTSTRYDTSELPNPRHVDEISTERNQIIMSVFVFSLVPFLKSKAVTIHRFSILSIGPCVGFSKLRPATDN